MGGQMNTKENIKKWSQNARDFGQDFYDAYKEEGDFWHKELLNPHVVRLIKDHKPGSIIDVGCGEGYLSRILARAGYQVTGLEPSDLINYARAYEEEDQLGIDYLKKDICDLDHKEAYDLAVSINVFMDIPDFDGPIKNTVASIKPGGRLIFSILHPCFTGIIRNKTTGGFEKKWDYEDKGYLVTEEYSSVLELKQKNDIMVHRPLSSYINKVIGLGLEIKEIIEPKLDLSYEEKAGRILRDCHIPSFVIICADKAKD